MRKRRIGVTGLLLTLALLAFGGAAGAQSEGTTVAGGFNSPQGVLVAPDGSVWVTEGGMGGEQEITMSNPETGEDMTITIGETARVVQVAADGTQIVAATLPSMTFGQEVVGAGRLALLDGTLYASSAEWIETAGPERMPLMGVIASIADGQATEFADTWAFEVTNNPEPFMLHSHPYGLAVGPDDMLWVADAGGNDLLKIDPASGAVELVTVFAGVPSPLPNAVRDGAMESDPVPTSVAFDAEGNAYVSLLPGFPFLPGSAKVVKVTPDGQTSDYATGLTMLTDLRTAPDGSLYAVSIGQFTEQGPTPNSGAIIRIKEGAASETVIGGLMFPTSIDFTPEGNAYVTTNGIGAPGTGELVRYDGLTRMAGTPIAAAAGTGGEAGTAVAPETMPTTGGVRPSGWWIAVVAGGALVAASLMVRRRLAIGRVRQD
jgi:sugar lactone lactonase YvrE